MVQALNGGQQGKAKGRFFAEESMAVFDKNRRMFMCGIFRQAIDSSIKSKEVCLQLHNGDIQQHLFVWVLRLCGYLPAAN